MMKKSKLGSDMNEAREDRFMLPGIDFKAKMIGVEPVGQARGDQMCMDAMIKLKFLVKTSGEHKPRIIINISIEGIRLMNEKTREVLHQHEVHRISFISRDSTDLRAFGYVYGEHGNHKFYAIKTEKASDAVVLTLKDLFEVVLDLKKHQIAEQKKAEEITGQVVAKPDIKQAPSEPVHASFKNPPPAEFASEPVYAAVNKPKLTDIAAEVSNQGLPEPTGIIDLEQEVKNLQMGLDEMEEFDLNPQTPTSPGPDPFNSPQPAAAPATDPFLLAGPPPAQRAPAPAMDAFGSSDPFAIQATPVAVVNSAPPPASKPPSADLFGEFKDTFTTPVPQPQVNAFQTPVVQSAPNPFGGMAAPAPAAAPFNANFGGMGGAAPAGYGAAPGGFGAAPGGFGAAPVGFGATPGGFGTAPGGFGAPAPPPQQAADPFGGGMAFGDGVLQPDSTPNPLVNQNSAPQKNDPFSDFGALGSAKAEAPKTTKDMFANYKIGKPGEPQPTPEIKLTGGPKRPPPAIPTNGQSSTCHPSKITPPSSLNLTHPHTQREGAVAMPSPEGPPPSLPPDIVPTQEPPLASCRDMPSPKDPPPPLPPEVHKQNHDSVMPKPANSLPVPSTPPPPLPNYMNVDLIHKSLSAEINFNNNTPPPLPPRSKSSTHLRQTVSNPLPLPPRNRSHSTRSTPPLSPHSETASVKSCDARFITSSPTSTLSTHPSPAPVVTTTPLSTLDEIHCEDHSSGVTSISAASHSNSMNSLSSVFDSNNVSNDTFDNDSFAASPTPSPIALSLCHAENAAKPIDILPSHSSSSSSSPAQNGRSSASQDSLYSSVETLSLTSQTMIHSTAGQQPPRHHSNDSTTTTTSSSSSSVRIISSSAPITESRSVSSPLTLTNLPVHEDPFADDPFSRHSPSVEKTFVLHTSVDHFANAFTDNKKDKIHQTGPWPSSHAAASNSNFDSHSGVVANSDPFAPGGAPVTNGGSAASTDLFGSQFDTFDFSKPN